MKLSNDARFTLSIGMLVAVLMIWACVVARGAESPEVEAARQQLEASLPLQPGDDQVITADDGITVGNMRLANLYYDQWGVEYQGRLNMDKLYQDLTSNYGKLLVAYQDEKDGRVAAEAAERRNLWWAGGFAAVAVLEFVLLVVLK